MQEQIYSEEDLREMLHYALCKQKRNGYIEKTIGEIVREII